MAIMKNKLKMHYVVSKIMRRAEKKARRERERELHRKKMCSLEVTELWFAHAVRY